MRMPFVLGLAGFLMASPAATTVLDVWAVNDGEKILRGALDHPARRKNSVWDGRRVALFGSRNETVAFQFIVPGERKSLTVNRVALEFGEKSLQVELFSQHYLRIDKPTPSDREGGWFWYKAAAPEFAPAWYPDALVPLAARAGRGGPPFEVGQGALQGFWADIRIPRKGVGPGRHRGTLTVSTTAGERNIAVELEVLDLTLPDKDPVKTMVYFSDVERRHGRKDPALKREYRFMAHRHRFDVAEYVGFGEIEAYKPYLTGEAYTPANGYRGPGEGIGHAVFGVEYYGAAWETKEDYRRESDRWMTWFEANAPGVVPFLYLIDEPGKDRFEWIRERASWIHDHSGPGRKLPVFVTKMPQEGLDGAVDIWATVADQVKLGLLPARRNKGERWWFYNGMRPMSGAVTIDAPALDYRVQPWICWLHGVELWFYWESTHWRHNHQGPRARQDQNVWVDSVTFTNGKVGIHGDGTLFYPGEDAIFPDQDRGVPGPISSIRMKNLRRGQQDVAYLVLAEEAGKGEMARAIARKQVPRAFSEARADQPVSWSGNGSDWDEARRAVANLLR